MPPKVNVLPAVTVAQAALGDETLDALDCVFEPGRVVEPAGEESEGLARVLGLDWAVAYRLDRLEVDATLGREERAARLGVWLGPVRSGRGPDRGSPPAPGASLLTAPAGWAPRGGSWWTR